MLTIVKSDVREIINPIVPEPEHLIGYEMYLLNQSVSRLIELYKKYPQDVADQFDNLWAPAKAAYLLTQIVRREWDVRDV